MAISAVNKKAAGGRTAGGHPMLSGILIGLVLGVGLSAAVAVWVSRMPSPFQNRALEGAGPPPAVIPPAAPSAPPANASAPATQPGNSAAAAGGATAGAAGPAVSGASNPATAGAPPGAASGDASTAASAASGGKALESGTATLQVGAFASEEDAMRQVETIAMVAGAHAQVIPPSGEQNLYRVRIGPVQRGNDLTELVDALKANGISTTVVRTPASAARANP